MSEDSEGVPPDLPASTLPRHYLLKLGPETARALHDLAGLRAEPAGRVARKLLELHAPLALVREKALREGSEA